MLLIIENPRFRLLWASGGLAGLGALAFMTVHGWLTLTLTDSPFWVGAAMGAGGLGMMSFVGLGGVLADRLPRRRLVAGAGVSRAAAAALLAVPVAAGSVQLWHILATAILFGASEAIRAPAYMALIVDLVGRERVMAANAANFAALGIAGVVAPLAGASIITAWGIEWAYLFVTGTELAAATMIVRIKVPPAAATAEGDAELTAGRHDAPWRAFKRGAAYVFGTPKVRTLILMGLVGESFGWAHISMLPVMARDVLGAGVAGLGYLQSASFAGLLFSTVAMSSRRDIQHKERLLMNGAAGFGLLLVAFSASRYLPLSLALLAAAYASAAVYEVSLTTLIQTVVPDEMRGRVVSFQAFTWGANGVSGFHMGAMAGLLGAPVAIAVGAGVMLANLLRLAPGAPRLEDTGGG